jgi:hypothetical protein
MNVEITSYMYFFHFIAAKTENEWTFNTAKRDRLMK